MNEEGGGVYLALLRAYAKHGGCVSTQYLVGCKQDAVALHANQTLFRRRETCKTNGTVSGR